MCLRRSSLGLVLALALLAPSRGGAFVLDGDDKATGPLTAQRFDRFVCTVINKTDAPIVLEVSFKTPEGVVLDQSALSGIPPGIQFRRFLPVPFGPNVTAYCHVTVETGATVVGNLRVDDPQGRTRTSSALRGDLHGKIDGILDTLGGAPP